MRATIVLNFPPNDHRVVYARGAAKELARRGHQVTLVLQKGSGFTREAKRKDYRVVGLSGDVYSFAGQIRFMIDLIFLLLRERPDIVHGRNPFSSVLPAMILRKLHLSRFVIVYDVRGLWIDYAFFMRRIGRIAYRILLLIEGLVTKGVDGIIAISERLRKVMIDRGVDGSKIDTILGDGVDLDQFRGKRRRAGTDGPKVVGYVGSLSKWRKPEEMMKAFDEARRRSEIEMNLVLVGPSDDNFKRLHILAESLDLGDHVSFVGPLPHHKAIQEMYKFDVALSYDSVRWLAYEVAVHTKIFEYLVTGVPIVATNHPVHEEVLEHGYNAVLTEPNPHAFASGILEVINNPLLSRRLSENGYETAVRHDIARKTRRIEQIYMAALRKLG